jgi:hypothetical protein
MALPGGGQGEDRGLDGTAGVEVGEAAAVDNHGVECFAGVTAVR